MIAAPTMPTTMPTIAPVERPLLPFFGDEVDEAVGAEVDDDDSGDDEEEGAMDVSMSRLVIITPVNHV